MKRYFGSSGVRGVVGEFITTDLAMKLGLGLATQLGEGSLVVIGRDTRTSGKMLERALVSGLLSGGCNAELIGIFPTPGVAYLTNALNKDAGIMKLLLIIPRLIMDSSSLARMVSRFFQRWSKD